MKNNFCILSLILISGLLCGCGLSGEADRQTDETSINSSLNDSLADCSDQNDVSLHNDNEIDSADDLSFLTEIGVINSVKNCLIWENFIQGVYSELNNNYKEVIEIDGKYYCEMIITWEDISELEDALGEKLVLSETGEYYECPFKTFSDLENHAKKYLLNDKIAELKASEFIIEKYDSLYILFACPNFRDYKIVSADILNQTDNEIRFSLTLRYKHGLEDSYCENRYTFNKIGNDWVLTDKSW